MFERRHRLIMMILFIALLWMPFNTMGQQKEIVGYFPSWKWRTPGNLVTPANIPYEKLTMLNYAFFYPRPDGRLSGRDTVGDERNLKGERIGKGAFKPGTSLVDLAHRRGVRVLLSVGGWADSDNFPEVASSEKGRTSFAHSCIEQVTKYDFDGIDIDWEFPGYALHKGTQADKSNFTKLLHATRDSLDAYGKKVGRKFLLTAALPAGRPELANFETDTVSRLLDFLNVMTYDLNGEWDSLSGYNAPLYAPSSNDSLRNLDAVFRYYTQDLGVSPGKINLGVPFYGHTYAKCSSLYAPHSGSDTLHFSTHGCFYYDIVKLKDISTKGWDDRAKVPSLFIPSWSTFISYDDERSVGYKAEYVLDHQCAGLIIWEITGDRLPDGTTPLLDVISSTFKHSPDR